MKLTLIFVATHTVLQVILITISRILDKPTTFNLIMSVKFDFGLSAKIIAKLLTW